MLKAFAYHPCEYSVSSGLFRLSCPKLVQAIDQYEREGAITEYNKHLLENVKWQQSFDAANLVTRDIRRELVDTYPGGIDKVGSPFKSLLCLIHLVLEALLCTSVTNSYMATVNNVRNTDLSC
jgi:Protein of unknown function (DUF501)